MELKEAIVKEIDKVPAQYSPEIFDFVCFLETKNIKDGMETAIASQSSLEKDWLHTEENEAWKNL